MNVKDEHQNCLSYSRMQADSLTGIWIDHRKVNKAHGFGYVQTSFPQTIPPFLSVFTKDVCNGLWCKCNQIKPLINLSGCPTQLYMQGPLHCPFDRENYGGRRASLPWNQHLCRPPTMKLFTHQSHAKAQLQQGLGHMRGLSGGLLDTLCKHNIQLKK